MKGNGLRRSISPQTDQTRGVRQRKTERGHQHLRRLLFESLESRHMLTTVVEGQPVLFAINRPTSIEDWVYVNFQAVEATATSSDFALSSGTIAFGPDDTQQVIQISTYPDLVREGTESFTVNLSGPAGFSATQTGTILDDPTNIPDLSVGDVTVVEGQPAVFTVTLSGPSSNLVSVNYQTVDATATWADFGMANGTLQFWPGETTKSVSVTTYPDLVREATETFQFQVAGPPDTWAAATGSVLDDPMKLQLIGNEFPNHPAISQCVKAYCQDGIRNSPELSKRLAAAAREHSDSLNLLEESLAPRSLCNREYAEYCICEALARLFRLERLDLFEADLMVYSFGGSSVSPNAFGEELLRQINERSR